MNRLPKPGNVVAYFDREYEEWYAVRFVKPVDKRHAQVLFVGSEELREIHVGEMAYPNRSRATRR